MYIHAMCRVPMVPGPQPSILPLKEIVQVNGERWHGLDHYLMHRYLVQHPRRVQELLRVLPEAKEGLCASWSITPEGCSLERIGLLHGNDALTELLIRGALFPGLRLPIKAWWPNGRIRPFLDLHAHLDDTVDLDHGAVKYLGPWRPVEHHWSSKGFEQWPFRARLAVLPVLILLFPVAYFIVLFRELRKVSNFRPFYILFMPLAMVLFGFSFLFPRTHSFTLRLLRPINERLSVRRLLDDAFTQPSRHKVSGN